MSSNTLGRSIHGGLVTQISIELRPVHHGARPNVYHQSLFAEDFTFVPHPRRNPESFQIVGTLCLDDST
jgi:hypothetical protein